MPLRDALQRLSGDGQPRLKAAAETAWTRVTAYSQERPLRDVLLGLGVLLNYQWEWRTPPGGDSPAQYVLGQGIGSRLYEESLWQETLERAGEPLFALAAYTRTPAADWARRLEALGGEQPTDTLLRQDNLRYLTHPATHGGLELLTTLSRQQRRELVEQEELYLSWSAMTPGQRLLARTIVSHPSRYDENEQPLPATAYRRKIEGNQIWLEQFGLRLTVARSPITGQVTYYDAGVDGTPVTCAALPDGLLDQTLLPIRGRPYDRPPQNPGTLYTGLEQRPFPPDFKADPGKARTWSEVVQQLSRVLPMPLFSDDFTGTRDPADRFRIHVPTLDKLSLAAALDALCKAYDHLWWTNGDALFFRSRSWFVERRYEVPPPILERLGEQIGPQHRMNPAALATLTGLTLQQLQGLSAASTYELSRSGAPARARGPTFLLCPPGIPLPRVL